MFRDFTDVVVLHIKKGCTVMKNSRHFFLIVPCIFHCLTVKTDKCDVGSLISNQTVLSRYMKINDVAASSNVMSWF